MKNRIKTFLGEFLAVFVIFALPIFALIIFG